MHSIKGTERRLDVAGVSSKKGRHGQDGHRGTTCGAMPELKLLFKVRCKITGAFPREK